MSWSTDVETARVERDCQGFLSQLMERNEAFLEELTRAFDQLVFRHLSNSNLSVVLDKS